MWDRCVCMWASLRPGSLCDTGMSIYMNISLTPSRLRDRYVCVYIWTSHSHQAGCDTGMSIYMNISLTPGRLCDTGMSILYIYMNISHQAGCVRQVGLYLDIITQAGVSVSQHHLGTRWVKRVVWYRCVYWAVKVGLLTPLTFARHCLSLGCFYVRCILSSQLKAVTVNLRILHCQV